MKLAFFLSHSASPHTVGQWRLPDSFEGYRYDRAEYWEHVGRTTERGGIDMIFLIRFLLDIRSLRGQQRRNAALRRTCPRHDPLPLIPIMARVTRQCRPRHHAQYRLPAALLGGTPVRHARSSDGGTCRLERGDNGG